MNEAEKLYRLYLAGGVPVTGFRERNDPLERRKTEIAAEVPRLQGEIDFLRVRHLACAEILSEAQSLYDRWDTLDFAHKREVVETIVNRITIGQGDIEIDLSGLPQASANGTAGDIGYRLDRGHG